MYIYNSTIANNTSKEIGGGINNCKNGNLYVINSTVAGNATTNGTYSGGGIGNNDSTLVCTNSILLDNVYLSSDTVEEQDSYGYNWLWTVLIIQSFSIVLLAGVIVYRKKFRG